MEDGDIFMNYGSHGYRYTEKFDLMFPHYFSDMVFISRAPRPAEQYKSVYLPFDLVTWKLIYSHLLLISLAFLATHSVYSRSLKHARLHNAEDAKTNFFLFTVFRFTEPENIPWFTRKWSSGKFLVFLWTWFSLLIVSFYNCNLRAHLTAIKYEDSIDTLSDVLENGERPWILNEAVTLQ